MIKTKSLKSGTTTVGIVCDRGIVLAAERKATLGYLVASKEDTKIVKIDDHIALTQAGMVGDLQSLARILKAECALYEMRNEKKIPVNSAATLLQNILYSGRWSFFPYMVQIILAGYDARGTNLFILHPDGSKLEEKKYFSTGSGSPVAFGVLEALFKENVSIEDAKKIAVKSVKAAVERDIASGGKGIDLAIIDQKGFRLLEKQEVNVLMNAE